MDRYRRMPSKMLKLTFIFNISMPELSQFNDSAGKNLRTHVFVLFQSITVNQCEPKCAFVF